jgi:RNA polymerase sigma factor (sigma-70 family)
VALSDQSMNSTPDSRTQLSDAELIIASQREPRYFRELYDRWAEPLLAYFYRRVIDAEVAADLLAETFALAFEKRGRFRDRGAPGAAWLYGIASKELSRYFRRQRVQLRTVERLGVAIPRIDDESALAIARLVDVDTRATDLDSALGRMTASEREAVQLRVVAELDYPDIAVRLNCSVGAARVRVHRGLARLSQLLEGQS